jgi:hypothetical protein
VVVKYRNAGDRPYRLQGAGHVDPYRPLSIDELEQLLGIG